MAFITIREYDPDSGALLGNITSLSFGEIGAGTHTPVKVLDIAFSDVSSVGNVYLGLISGGGLTVNADPSDLAADGSAGNGQFGIMTSSSFDSTIASQPLTRHFAGSNGTGASTNDKNVYVGTRSSTLSSFIYLDIEAGAASTGGTNGAYKVFFDFS